MTSRALSLLAAVALVGATACGSSSGHGGGLAAAAAIAGSASVASSARGATPAPTGAGSSSSPGSVSGGSVAVGGVAAVATATPSDDPDDWVVDTTKTWDPVVSPITWVAPSAALPASTPCQSSNNNGAISFHEGRLFFAWRTSFNHFASAATELHVVSSPDLGKSWVKELTVALGTDIREPQLLSFAGKLVLTYFEAGSNPVQFDPHAVWQTVRTGPATWTAPVKILDPNVVPWDVKVRRGRAWMTAYKGNHYATSGPSAVELYLKTSTDGLTWQDVDPARPVIYTGGVSEVAIEFTKQGDLWAVTRNEDGDATGFGAHTIHASASSLASWQFPSQCDPFRYDSPKMFRHGDDLYLVARRQPTGPYDLFQRWLPLDKQRVLSLAAYSVQPKRTTLYKLDTVAGRPVALMDLPGNGDTAFPSIRRTGAHTFLLANYTSPLGNPDRTWIHGQLSREGTQIYFMEISFKAR